MNNLAARLAEISALPESDAKWQKIEDLATNLFEEGASLGTIKGFTVDEVEAAYHMAYGLYQQRRFDEALKLFQYFSMYEHTDRRFWMGWAACLQKLKRHDPAIKAYGVATMLDVGQPDAPFHAAECYIAMRDWVKAKQSLETVLLIAEGEEAHLIYAERANNLIELVVNKQEEDSDVV